MSSESARRHIFISHHHKDDAHSAKTGGACCMCSAIRVQPNGDETTPKKTNVGFLTKYFRGYDFFISYRKKEAYTYAKRLASTLKQVHGFDCYLDERLLPLGESIKSFLKSRLRRSRLLILLATSGVAARDSEHVPFELGFFARSRRKIATIYVGDAQPHIPQDLEPWSALQGRRYYFENESAVRNGEPSRSIHPQKKISHCRWVIASSGITILHRFNTRCDRSPHPKGSSAQALPHARVGALVLMLKHISVPAQPAF
jgi:hypothetical protein